VQQARLNYRCRKDICLPAGDDTVLLRARSRWSWRQQNERWLVARKVNVVATIPCSLRKFEQTLLSAEAECECQRDVVVSSAYCGLQSRYLAALNGLQTLASSKHIYKALRLVRSSRSTKCKFSIGSFVLVPLLKLSGRITDAVVLSAEFVWTESSSQETSNFKL